MRILARASTTDDYRELARRRLPAFLFHYIDGAAGREVTASRNRTAMDEIALEQRVMIDVHSVSTELELFGTALSMPVILGPVGLAGLLARRGEVQAHRAASMAGTAFCLSTLGICALDEVAGAKAPPPWFQLYMIRDRAFMKDLLQSIEQAHVPALVLTVDVPVSGIRPRERRFGLTSGMATHIAQAIGKPGWTWDVALNGGPLIFGSVARAAPQARRLGDFWGWLGANFDPSVTWQDISFVRELWSGPIIVKGIMSPSDARAALAAGADGIVVSNHGGRQLDGTLATIACLPAVVDAVGDRVPVLVDGGIRSGTDVVKALASGARACLLGRAWAFALAAGGERALSRYLEDLRSEIRNTLALTGCADIRDAGPGLLASRASS
jgi:L-lactate dehydrogenase (cytochrome)